MKTTSREKLIEVHGVILLQLMYNKEICRLLDRLDQRIRNIQKKMMDKKRELEFELCRISGQNIQPSLLIPGNPVEEPDHDPATGWKNPNSWIYKNQLTVTLLSLNRQVSAFDQALAEHEQFKVRSKTIREKMDKIYQNDELLTLLTNKNDGSPAASLGKTKLNLLLKVMEKVKEQFFNTNHMWITCVKDYQQHLDMFELIDRKGNFDAHFS